MIALETQLVLVKVACSYHTSLHLKEMELLMGHMVNGIQ